MKVYSFRLRPARIAAVLCAAVLIIAGGAALFSGGEEAIPVLGLFKKGIPGETEAERREYIAQTGWQVEDAPVSVDEVIIPGKFDEVYDGYNAIQKEQGFDLAGHRGKTVGRYRYLVTNYPDSADDVILTLLVHKGCIIGADISSAAGEGFLKAAMPAQE